MINEESLMTYRSDERHAREELELRLQIAEAALNFERDRTAKLVERLRAIRILEDWFKKWQVIENTIAEYEASL